jgi:hypothetical protein
MTNVNWPDFKKALESLNVGNHLRVTFEKTSKTEIVKKSTIKVWDIDIQSDGELDHKLEDVGALYQQLLVYDYFSGRKKLPKLEPSMVKQFFSNEYVVSQRITLLGSISVSCTSCFQRC